MPFQSKSQQRFLFARHPEIAKEWASHTPNISSLPDKAKKRKKQASIEDVMLFVTRMAKEAIGNGPPLNVAGSITPRMGNGAPPITPQKQMVAGRLTQTPGQAPPQAPGAPGSVGGQSAGWDMSKGWYGGYFARQAAMENNPGSQDAVARQLPPLPSTTAPKTAQDHKEEKDAGSTSHVGEDGRPPSAVVADPRFQKSASGFDPDQENPSTVVFRKESYYQAKSLYPFACAFIERCVDQGLSSDRVEALVKSASAIDPLFAAEFEGLRKVAGVPMDLLRAGGRLIARGSGGAQRLGSGILNTFSTPIAGTAPPIAPHAPPIPVARAVPTALPAPPRPSGMPAGPGGPLFGNNPGVAPRPQAPTAIPSGPGPAAIPVAAHAPDVPMASLAPSLTSGRPPLPTGAPSPGPGALDWFQNPLRQGAVRLVGEAPVFQPGAWGIPTFNPRNIPAALTRGAANLGDVALSVATNKGGFQNLIDIPRQLSRGGVRGGLGALGRAGAYGAAGVGLPVAGAYARGDLQEAYDLSQRGRGQLPQLAGLSFPMDVAGGINTALGSPFSTNDRFGQMFADSPQRGQVSPGHSLPNDMQATRDGNPWSTTYNNLRDMGTLGTAGYDAMNSPIRRQQLGYALSNAPGAAFDRLTGAFGRHPGPETQRAEMEGRQAQETQVADMAREALAPGSTASATEQARARDIIRRQPLRMPNFGAGQAAPNQPPQPQPNQQTGNAASFDFSGQPTEWGAQMGRGVANTARDLTGRAIGGVDSLLSLSPEQVTAHQNLIQQSRAELQRLSTENSPQAMQQHQEILQRVQQSTQALAFNTVMEQTGQTPQQIIQDVVTGSGPASQIGQHNLMAEIRATNPQVQPQQAVGLWEGMNNMQRFALVAGLGLAAAGIFAAASGHGGMGALMGLGGLGAAAYGLSGGNFGQMMTGDFWRNIMGGNSPNQNQPPAVHFPPGTGFPFSDAGVGFAGSISGQQPQLPQRGMGGAAAGAASNWMGQMARPQASGAANLQEFFQQQNVPLTAGGTPDLAHMSPQQFAQIAQSMPSQLRPEALQQLNAAVGQELNALPWMTRNLMTRGRDNLHTLELNLPRMDPAQRAQAEQALHLCGILTGAN